MSEIDKIDRKILSILQGDGRIANVELAERIGLSPTSVGERLKRLQRDGFVEGYGARLNPQRLGLGLLVFVEVMLDKTTPDVFERFAKAVQARRSAGVPHGGGRFRLSGEGPPCRHEAYRRFLGETCWRCRGCARPDLRASWKRSSATRRCRSSVTETHHAENSRALFHRWRSCNLAA